MKSVQISTKRIDDYLEFMDKEKKEELFGLMDKVKGIKVLNINATAFGGGVAEILQTLVPLMKDAGINVEWKVIEAEKEFYEFTKRMHNALQGKEDVIENHVKDLYLETAKKNAEELDARNYDVVIIHDPQPFALPEFYNFGNAKIVWRCHIDTSTPNKQYQDFLRQFASKYTCAIFTLKSYAGEFGFPEIREIAPSIDPLSDKNRELTKEELKKACTKLKIDAEKPLITQVSRFDPWKDPLGVVDVYRELKKTYNDLQLLMIGSMASDDPEGWQIYEDILRYIGRDYDVGVYTNFHDVGNIEVNAAQKVSDVVIQKSLREGFALTVSEALWKKTPVVGGDVGGIPLQIKDNYNGYLIKSTDEAIEATRKILSSEDLKKKLGENGKETVRKNFLITRQLVDYLKLFSDII
ncbi:MAG: glycosyltransferase [Kosmotogaceae bacterium]